MPVKSRICTITPSEIQIKAVHFYDLIHPVFNSGDILPIVVSIVQPQPQESYEDSSKKD